MLLIENMKESKRISNFEKKNKDKMNCININNNKEIEKKNSENDFYDFKSTKSNSFNCSSEENIKDKKREQEKKKNNYNDTNYSKSKDDNSSFNPKLAKRIFLNKCTIYLFIGKNGNKNYLEIIKVLAGNNYNIEIAVNKFNNYLNSS